MRKAAITSRAKKRQVTLCTLAILLLIALGVTSVGALNGDRAITETVAVNPSLDVSQYAHTSWSAKNGDFRGAVLSVTQTADGYLWLGTDIGLSRFDGARFVEWRLPPGTSLPKNPFQKVLGTRDGSLWIGGKGLGRLKDGKLTTYPALSDTWINAIRRVDSFHVRRQCWEPVGGSLDGPLALESWSATPLL